MMHLAAALAYLSVADSPEARELRFTTESAKQQGRTIGLIRFQAQRLFDAGMRMVDDGADPETVAIDLVNELETALPASDGVARFYIQATIGSLQKALGTESDSMEMAS